MKTKWEKEEGIDRKGGRYIEKGERGDVSMDKRQEKRRGNGKRKERKVT